MAGITIFLLKSKRMDKLNWRGPFQLKISKILNWLGVFESKKANWKRLRLSCFAEVCKIMFNSCFTVIIGHSNHYLTLWIIILINMNYTKPFFPKKNPKNKKNCETFWKAPHWVINIGYLKSVRLKMARGGDVGQNTTFFICLCVI